MDAPHIIYIPGMCGMIWLDRRFVRALRAADLNVTVHDWTRFLIPLRNLRNSRQHDRAADELAALISESAVPSELFGLPWRP